MPLYIGDYLADTGHLTTEQHGAYLLLMMHYWMRGGLPRDENQLAAIARMPVDKWRSNCHTLASFFASDWRHPRIESELTKTRLIKEKRALAGLKGAFVRHGKTVANAKQMPTQSQSHIERGSLRPVPVETRRSAEKENVSVSTELIDNLKKRGLA